nr:MAG: CHAT domain-containing protein [Leptolyngbya sp. IPPAS B-1204]
MSSSRKNSKQKTILFLAANPQNSTPLDLAREVKEIEEGLQRSQKRDKFLLEQVWAVTPGDVQRAMLNYRPQIVHFSGHGMGEVGLVLENAAGQGQFVKSTALAGLFELFADKVECVVLNACYSEVQAVAIAHHIPFVVGMNQAVGDRAARVFAVGFYDALGAGESFDFAYKLGCNRIALEGIAEDSTPVITRKLEVASLPLPEPSEPDNAIPAPVAVLAPVVVEPSRSGSMTLASEQVALEELGGQVPLDSLFYIKRPPIEEQCYDAIVRPGALIRVKAPRQMGKSSLTIRILDYAEKQGYRTTWLNLQRAGDQALSSLDAFLRWLCDRTTRNLRLPNQVEEYWQGIAGSMDKCTDYFELYLLEEINAPLALCLDEVDEVFKHPVIASDFLGLLRSWHEESKISSVSAWRNLRLVLTHSEEVYIPLNINQSPFNVGVPIELPPFTQAQLADLVQRHGLQWSEAEIGQLMAMVGGHPYLTRVALQQIVRGEVTLIQFLQVAPTQEWLFGSHLRRHLGNLEERNLASAMKQVVTSDQPVRLSSAEASKLDNMGLVRFQGNDVYPLCDLYRHYFKEILK